MGANIVEVSRQAGSWPGEPDMTARQPEEGAARQIKVTETLVANAALGAVSADWDADRAVTVLYAAHYRSLVRLAALLLRDVGAAEEVVQDSFVAMHDGWRRLRDNDKALSYLRQSVVNRSRSVLRHRVVVDRNAPKPPPDMPSAEQGAITLLERSAVVTALRTLPPRQREEGGEGRQTENRSRGKTNDRGGRILTTTMMESVDKPYMRPFLTLPVVA